MLKRYQHARSFLLLIHINLNISDILVLGVHLPGLMGWLITSQWLAGNAMCKIMRFLDAFVWAASSNIMVCVALYRLTALRYPLWVSAVGHSQVPRMLATAWTLAAISTSPQLFIWRQVEFPNITQCQSIWANKISLERMERLQNPGVDPSVMMTEDDMWWMKFYDIQHVIIIFYIPLFILVVCYFLIVKDIYKTLNNDQDSSSVMYMSEISRLSTCGKRVAPKESTSLVAVRPIRGQDKFKRAKVRSLRITLLLILTYAITWLPYNLLTWWMIISFDTFTDYQEALFPLGFLVILNSVINPFIYGRFQGLKLLFSCKKTKNKRKWLRS
ncbi:unnamed protein product [Auanema sp. JU1783]|nr:unnamed protein product [Auanema sp. JU1783]